MKGFMMRWTSGLALAAWATLAGMGESVGRPVPLSAAENGRDLDRPDPSARKLQFQELEDPDGRAVGLADRAAELEPTGDRIRQPRQGRKQHQHGGERHSLANQHAKSEEPKSQGHPRTVEQDRC